jgi:protein SCO1/2
MSARARGIVACILSLALVGAAGAGAVTGLPEALERVGLDQQVGESVPLDLEFTDHLGNRKSLGDYFDGRPVILVPVYYDCPMLCTMILEGLTKTLKAVTLDPGKDFQIVAVSFDPQESAEQAAARRATSVDRYGHPDADSGMHFLVGDSAEVEALLDAVGFHVKYDENTGEFAHVAALVVLTPEGRVARYFLGVEYPPRDLRLTLVEAADEQIGTVVDQVLLYCFKYDPTTGRYTAATMNLIRLGGLLTLVALGAYVVLNLRRERMRRRTAGASA